MFNIDTSGFVGYPHYIAQQIDEVSLDDLDLRGHGVSQDIAQFNIPEIGAGINQFASDPLGVNSAIEDIQESVQSAIPNVVIGLIGLFLIIAGIMALAAPTAAKVASVALPKVSTP